MSNRFYVSRRCDFSHTDDNRQFFEFRAGWCVRDRQTGEHATMGHDKTHDEASSFAAFLETV